MWFKYLLLFLIHGLAFVSNMATTIILDFENWLIILQYWEP